MKYFIPAWYSSHHWWESEAEPFYYKYAETAFDDMISLMSMHRQNKYPFGLIVLNYTPDLRTFLHRQELFSTDYWSVFDHIQGFTDKMPTAIDYRQLDWPEGTEFMYLPYMVRALMPDNQHANVHFNEEGYVIWLEVFHADVQRYRYILDDRGYVSSVVYFDDVGTAYCQRYMTAMGDWILQEDLITQTVHVNTHYQDTFELSQYPTMEAVIFEFLIAYRDAEMAEADAVIVAADERDNEVLADIFEQQSLCVSVFHQREQLSTEDVTVMGHEVKWLVDTLENERLLTAYLGEQDAAQRLMRITPFDAQMMPNMSSQLYETYIGVWLDGLETDAAINVLAQLEGYLAQDTALRVVLLTEQRINTLDAAIQQEVVRVNAAMNRTDDMSEAVADLIEVQPPTEYVEIKHVPFEMDIIEAITTLRIVIDLSQEPDLFLQICCLSAGLPQINRRETDYVTHGLNGHVLTADDDLHNALDYYLMQLKNWNQSYAYAMKLAKKYASDNIIAQLDTLIEGEKDGATV